MKKWLSLLSALLMCGMMAAGIQAVDTAEELTYEMAGETAMRPLAAGSAADLEEVLDAEEFKSYLASEFEARNTTISITEYGIPASEEYMEAVADFIHMEMAEYFHVKVVSFGGNGTAYVRINVEYTMSEAEYASAKSAWDAAVNSMLEGLSGLGDVEKALLLHDRLAERCAYDYQNYLDGTIPEYSYRAYGALVRGTAVCQGYAEAYQYLLGKVGIESWLNGSDVLNHVWNIVEIDGEKYHVDVTWDDPYWDVSGRVLHTNFLRSSAAFAESHTAYDYDTAPSDTTYDEYFWKYSESAFQLVNGEIYCIANDSIGIAALTTYEGAINAFENYDDEGLIWSVDDIWPAGKNSYWGGNYTRLVADGNCLYYNDSVSVYRYDVTTGKNPKVIWTPQHEFGDYFSIYGMWFDGNYLYCELSTTPNFDGSTKARYTMSYELYPVVHEHSFEAVVDVAYKLSDADCDSPAVYYYSCTSCYEVNREATFTYGEALGHTPAEAWETTAEEHWHICTVCGTETDKAAH
ncbi:MAG: hypothetical protein IKV57_07270, partial [Clostridia bacterium]|nr:hypothetical protein [Clostridia bacterium]